MMAWSKQPPDEERVIVTPDYDPDRADKGAVPEPWWTTLIYKAEKIGYAGIAAFLIYIGAMVLTNDVSDIKGNLGSHLTESKSDSEAIKKTLTSLVNVTVQQCVNAAYPSVPKRDACFTALTFAPVRDPR